MSSNHINQEQTEDAQARQIAGLLDAHAKRLSMRTLKQLEDGRARAVKAHAAQLASGSVNADGTMSQFGAWVDHHRMFAAGLLLATVIASVMVLQLRSSNESSDAFLLGADLPPEAFVDKGFEPSLNIPSVNPQQKT